MTGRTIILAALLVAVGASAAKAEYFGVSAPVPGHPSTRFADLVKAIVPDLQLGDGVATGSTTIEYHHVSHAYGGPAPAEIRIFGVEAIPFRVGGEQGLLALVDLGRAEDRVETAAVLALFDADLNLLDAADVGMDSQVGIEEEAIAVSATDDMAVIHSGHSNSNQSYDNHELIIFQDEHLSLLDVVFTFGDRDCGYENTQTPRYEVERDGEGHWPISVVVTDRHVVTDEDCGDAPAQAPAFEKPIAVTYRWSASIGGYVADSDAFDQLAAANAQRF